jgi:hypothetical protein
MEPKDETLLKDLRSFAESREIAKRDESEARVEQRHATDELVRTADEAFAQLRANLRERVENLKSENSLFGFADIGNSLIVSLAQVEATVQYVPGRFTDALGPHPPSLKLILSRTQQTLGGDSGEPGMLRYNPPRRSESFRPVEDSNGFFWDRNGELLSSSSVATYVLGGLVAYYKGNAPR